jgi:hypothetical protein
MCMCMGVAGVSPVIVSARSTYLPFSCYTVTSCFVSFLFPLLIVVVERVCIQVVVAFLVVGLMDTDDRCPFVVLRRV